jgi:hypothetical protein
VPGWGADKSIASSNFSNILSGPFGIKALPVPEVVRGSESYYWSAWNPPAFSVNTMTVLSSSLTAAKRTVSSLARVMAIPKRSSDVPIDRKLANEMAVLREFHDFAGQLIRGGAAGE